MSKHWRMSLGENGRDDQSAGAHTPPGDRSIETNSAAREFTWTSPNWAAGVLLVMWYDCVLVLSFNDFLSHLILFNQNLIPPSYTFHAPCAVSSTGPHLNVGSQGMSRGAPTHWTTPWPHCDRADPLLCTIALSVCHEGTAYALIAIRITLRLVECRMTHFRVLKGKRPSVRAWWTRQIKIIFTRTQFVSYRRA